MSINKVADNIERISGLRLLHIADPTIAALKTAGVKTVALLATRYTEIDMLLHDGDSPLPFFDATALHALAAVEEACAT